MLIESQERALRVSLRQIETELVWAETLLASTYHGALVSFADDLDDARRLRVAGLIHEARRLIEGFRDAFDLSPEEISKSRWIAAHVGQLWVVTQECDARHLRAYGPVNDELAARLQPAIEDLARTLLRLQLAARGQPPHATHA